MRACPLLVAADGDEQRPGTDQTTLSHEAAIPRTVAGLAGLRFRPRSGAGRVSAS